MAKELFVRGLSWVDPTGESELTGSAPLAAFEDGSVLVERVFRNHGFETSARIQRRQLFWARKVRGLCGFGCNSLSSFNLFRHVVCGSTDREQGQTRGIAGVCENTF